MYHKVSQCSLARISVSITQGLIDTQRAFLNLKRDDKSLLCVNYTDKYKTNLYYVIKQKFGLFTKYLMLALRILGNGLRKKINLLDLQYPWYGGSKHVIIMFVIFAA